jgi:hypothetical protein
LELIKELNPVGYEDSLTAMFGQKEFVLLVKTLKANSVSVINKHENAKSASG